MASSMQKEHLSVRAHSPSLRAHTPSLRARELHHALLDAHDQRVVPAVRP